MPSKPHKQGSDWRRDPRLYQILVLTSLAFYGTLALDLEIEPVIAATILGTALTTQLLFSRWLGLGCDWRSPLISGLSLCLLLRTTAVEVALLAAFVAIGSKFLIRRRGKHVFNPSALGLVGVVLLTDRAWVSPSQWGSVTLFAFLVAGLGMLVVRRAARSDVTLAFLAAWSAVVFGRALWLGDPLVIPLHQLHSGALLLFAFFMISDPKTTPDSRAGRILFASLVALGAGVVQFGLYRANGPLYALIALSLLVPLIDRFLPADRHHWTRRTDRLWTFVPQPFRAAEAAGPLPTGPLPTGSRTGRDAVGRRARRRFLFHSRKDYLMRRLTLLSLLALLALAPAPVAAFCGFYVARADTGLFNQASQVVLVRDGDRTVLTMANDFRGEPEEFAIVIPVPTFLEREQIHVADMALIDHLDAYTSPRLVEYFDDDPCARRELEMRAMLDGAVPMASGPKRKEKSLGVTVEASYTVGEYDIQILSAEDSRGLSIWLRQEGYRLPAGAEAVLGSYLKQGMRFFVARVNLEEQAALGFTYLRPLQVAYESRKFMLPIRLGTLNADGPQELFVYTLTRTGRVETTNYRTVRLPTGTSLPGFVKEDFGDFYRAMFASQVERERRRAVFLEYAWDMGWCDPCAADPLTPAELRELGVFWAAGPSPAPDRPIRPQASDVFVTRLHLRYDSEHFPEDLHFQETGDRTNFQGRYVLQHAWNGQASCEAADVYLASLPERWDREAENLASLTGWDIGDIRERMDVAWVAAERKPWWRRIWD